MCLRCKEPIHHFASFLTPRSHQDPLETKTYGTPEVPKNLPPEHSQYMSAFRLSLALSGHRQLPKGANTKYQFMMMESITYQRRRHGVDP